MVSVAPVISASWIRVTLVEKLRHSSGLESTRRLPVTRMIAIMIFVVSLATAAAAQGPPGLEKKELQERSSITVKVAGLTCTTALGSGTFSVSAYSFGATQETSAAAGGGGGTGKSTVMPLNLARAFDEC